MKKHFLSLYVAAQDRGREHGQEEQQVEVAELVMAQRTDRGVEEDGEQRTADHQVHGQPQGHGHERHHEGPAAETEHR